MRKLFLFLAFMSMSLMVSCSGGGPEGAAKKFLKHTNKGEFEEAKKYCDERTAGLLSMAQSMAGDRIQEMKDRDIDIDILSSEVNEEGDKALVKYQVKEGEQVAEKELDMVKVDGEWKASMNKEDARR